ncbi:hypothetical protein [Allobranchiibius huperziae]|uniref:Transmembrane protein n=1 Tax=Allobranchiibius huperziae TaxID=1874116 RepID=A0A853DBU3_9MICO|nr:hypothetical protein [Allobranchiibius huperziae]NYJ73449.1 hypothetical protein [Allobranchiibius huperziae]
MGLWGRARTAVSTTGHIVVLVVVASGFVFFVALGVDGLGGLHRPVHWGTFTETSSSCDVWDRQCTTTGDWLSQDGFTVKSGVTLDGSTGDDGSVRAGYQVGGISDDEDANVVHTAFWIAAGPWVAWLMALGTGGCLGWQVRHWPRNRGKPQRNARNGIVPRHAAAE